MFHPADGENSGASLGGSVMRNGIKALSRLSGTEHSQVLNYLKASGVERGLVLNFGSDRLPYERFVL